MLHSYSTLSFLSVLCFPLSVSGHIVLPHGVCVMGVKGALTSPEQSSSSDSSSGSVYNYSTVAEPALSITDQQEETINHNIKGHYVAT